MQFIKNEKEKIEELLGEVKERMKEVSSVLVQLDSIEKEIQKVKDNESESDQQYYHLIEYPIKTEPDLEFMNESSKLRISPTLPNTIEKDSNTKKRRNS